ncbi:polyribonucleotide nucleotidyltransferase [Candidatus Jorgensenbacteria bacterium RIFCSPLOWO2_02_FULL_45_12]|uniref:Polyribonucleotide nucleotidyltransferase n=2 Tax=Candidatus Joergenseniibacteriota TaxID=1752739 RepID=A0A1F6BPN9_9BACT|nr:MAG: Polyribonucleotide nucleotidyltransferase [Candidatus Jorgensenbacteria bacterium GW2011_GWA2_45_9]OGG38896.1 MAG: polyribonucleotide nucleotidyltransferase [Candidatus Jorgensenbacteria bacterium RIFCSPHIGHO2_02_FULL_45_20]OGG42380.1 MAG: polyribonucleotide nucleotidyltransferase [Candidatus Jorgensenbacteria bacterium RIFCSPLOWO2_02_FULL_45_12]
MELNRKIFKTELDGEEISIEVSELAGQTNASVIGKHGNTVVLATVVMGSEDRPGDFFPLTVDYEERFYAAGKIIGSRFVRREGRPSDEATLSARLIDRAIRPLFDHRLRRETHVVVTVLSYDELHDPDIIGLLSVSAALHISDIPWNGPVAGAKSIKKDEDGGLISKAFFAGPEKCVNMIELEGDELSESDAASIFRELFAKIPALVSFQNEIRKSIGKQKVNVIPEDNEDILRTKIKKIIDPEILKAFQEKRGEELKKKVMEGVVADENLKNKADKALAIFEEEVDAFIHREILEFGRRVDGRKFNEIRPLHSEVGLFSITHGSGLFIRGGTQVLAITTLGPSSAEQMVETMETTGKKRFMLHYNFPGFAVGESGRSRGPGRREIGHGALAAKALTAMIPKKEDFPYTIRVVAETLSSNGSSSMASTCAACLSLMDAGVPIRKHVAGIAIGLILDESGTNYKILTDIQGPEDHYGDMDFKVAGTEDGITAIQMDVKIKGITEPIFTEAIKQAKDARLEIIGVMKKALPAARKNVSPYAPKIVKLMIPADKIGAVIGPGGKNINGIIAASMNKISIDIEEDGTVYVSGVDMELVERACKTITASVKEYKVGEIINGRVIKILDFGAIVDLGGGRDGMIHVSELKEGFVKKVEDVVNLGDEVVAKIVKADPDGRIGLSLKNLI